jgi:4-amino-4-deoxy-L-arabinose transferase-like glycosyltransferase
MDGNEARAARIASICALVATAGLIASPLRGHVDDMDAQMYLVIARNLAHDGAWFDLHFLPGWLPRFREHLPFGFWPAAATIRLFGEAAVPITYGLIALAAVAVAGWIARKLGGAWAGVCTVLLLGTCEAIWHYGARPLLEPLLFLFATAAAGAALSDRWWLAAVLAAIAALVKGPFGLLPLASVALARLPRWRGLAAVAAATAPVCLFLLIDPAGGWREGYLHGQLLVSAVGQRSDGVALWWFPFSVIVRRFWPGLPFALLGLWLAIRNPRMRPLALSVVVMVVLLCLPQRKWGNHTYVAFPLLAALAGIAADEILRIGRRPALAASIAASLALAAWGVFASGIGTRILRPPCAFSTSLHKPLRALPPRTALLLVTPQPDLSALSELAAEFRLDPRPVASLGAAGSETFAVTNMTAPAGDWNEVARGEGWTLLRKGAMSSGP